jgi:uncharacterized protein YkwD
LSGQTSRYCLIGIASLFVFSMADAQEAPARPAEGEAAKVSEVEQVLFDKTNEERKKAALGPLKMNPVLMTMAREQSKLMADAKLLSHEVGGQTFSIRLKASKYPIRAAGENCAEGAETPAEAVGNWMTSPGHKANILNAEYQEVGVGMEVSSEGRKFYTQVFAAPFPSNVKPAEK